jgi:hypothetical protein
MSGAEQVSIFDAAVGAWAVRFESTLESRWDSLEIAACKAGSIASPSDRLDILNRVFDDFADASGSVIHEYFPPLLAVAKAQQQHLGCRPPLTWTGAQILEETCSFLGIDEEFDGEANPTQHSRVLAAAERIISYWLPQASGMDEESDDAFAVRVVSDWLSQDAGGEFLLPWWVDSNLRLVRLLAGQPFTSQSGADAETLSRTDTLNWVKLKESLLWNRLKRTLEDERWEAVIDAGKAGISIPDGRVSSDFQGNEQSAPHNKFVRDGETWVIEFDDETCRLPSSLIGLRYISVLLQHPGDSMSGLQLQSEICGLPLATRPTAELAVFSLAEAADDEAGDENNCGSKRPVDFSRHENLDDPGVRFLNSKLLELEEEATYALEIGDTQMANDKQRQYDEVAAHLKKSRNVHGRARTFSGENDKARMSVTKALSRAYEKIRPQAPKTAEYLASCIRTGSEFAYRDNSTTWKL